MNEIRNKIHMSIKIYKNMRLILKYINILKIKFLRWGKQNEKISLWFYYNKKKINIHILALMIIIEDLK